FVAQTGLKGFKFLLVGLVPMAGSYDELFFGDTGWQNVDLPILYMSGSRDSPGRIRDDFEAFTDDAIWVNLEGGVHESFGLCGTLDPMGLGMCSSLEPQLGYTLVNTYVLAFARRHVLDDQTMMVESILSGEMVPENITFNAR
ncbi:MAG: hypothetical protein AAFX99_35150, partial [Myxococcota bacterium]